MIELAEIIKNTNIYELAQKTMAAVDLSATEREVVSELDANFREIGRKGFDRDHEIAQFLQKTINVELYENPSEILDMLFERGNVGEFDDVMYTYLPPENTLEVHEAAFGGNVDESYLDISEIRPVWKNLQLETSLSMSELRRNGWKTVAQLSEYAVASFEAALYQDCLAVLDNAIAMGADNYITESTTMPTVASMDALASYIAERLDGDQGVIIALYKYILAASRLQPASEAMKDEIYRKGILAYYGGIPMKYFSSAKKVKGATMIPDFRILGVAGRVGRLDMKGQMMTYEIEEPDREVERLIFKHFTYGYSIDPRALKKVAKIVLASS